MTTCSQGPELKAAPPPTHFRGARFLSQCPILEVRSTSCPSLTGQNCPQPHVAGSPRGAVRLGDTVW